MIYGYCRVSTRGQAKDGNSLEAQSKLLKEHGAEKIYIDTFTGTKVSRPEFDKLIKDIEPGDRLIVTKLDRFARTAAQGYQIIKRLIDKDISVQVLNLGVLDNSPTGKLILQVMLAFAEFERDLIVERTQEGKAIAKQSIFYHEGRPPKYTKKQLDHAMVLLKEHSFTQVADMTGISRSTLVREKSKRSMGV